MTTNQPEPIESRLDRLETIFADMGDVIVAQSEAIDALTANINNRGEMSSSALSYVKELIAQFQYPDHQEETCTN